MRRQAQALARPSGYLLPRVVDQLSFCYTEKSKISQDKTGVLVTVEQGGEALRARLPTATIAALLLGPGCSITHAAVTTLVRHGTTISFVGEQGLRCYASTGSPSTTRWLTTAAEVSTNPEARLAAARRMYAMRFGEPVDDKSIEQMRGMEGSRVKALYARFAQEHDIPFKRQYTVDKFDDADPVNRALSAANACLYGITVAVLNSLGIHPGLGIIHSGSGLALVYDIADLYKAETTIPAAFEWATTPNPDRSVRHAFRDQLTLVKLVPRMVADIAYVLGIEPQRAKPPEPTLVSLWDPTQGFVEGGVSYAKPGVVATDPPGVEAW